MQDTYFYLLIFVKLRKANKNFQQNLPYNGSTKNIIGTIWRVNVTLYNAFVIHIHKHFKR